MQCKIDPKGTIEIDDVIYPAVGFGSYRLTGQTAQKAVSDALEIGYRLIDTATFYNNFNPVGEAVNAFGREQCYLISKVWHDSLTPKGVHEDIIHTLNELQTSYIDAYLIHWPNSSIPISETLHAMRETQTNGYVRHIGVSNFTVNHLKRALETGIFISWNQVEMHPHFYDPQLLKFCAKNSIQIQAWSPLARGKIRQDIYLNELSRKYHKTVPQISLKWILQHGCIPLPGSSNPVHMKENFDILDFTLTADEMERINKRAEQGPRMRITAERGLGFCDEFDIA